MDIYSLGMDLWRLLETLSSTTRHAYLERFGPIGGDRAHTMTVDLKGASDG